MTALLAILAAYLLFGLSIGLIQAWEDAPYSLAGGRWRTVLAVLGWTFAWPYLLIW